MAPPYSGPMVSADELDWLVYSYLEESGTSPPSSSRYHHTSFSLLNESHLAGPSTSSTAASPALDPTSPRPNGRERSTTAPARNPVMDLVVPPGHLVRLLQKGLLYLEAEARYRGDPLTPAPRVVGYPIPTSLPLPSLPKYVPAPTPPAPTPPPPIHSSRPSTATAKDAENGKGKGKASDRAPSIATTSAPEVPTPASSAVPTPPLSAGSSSAPKRNADQVDRDKVVHESGAGAAAVAAASDRKRAKLASTGDTAAPVHSAAAETAVAVGSEAGAVAVTSKKGKGKERERERDKEAGVAAAAPSEGATLKQPPTQVKDAKRDLPPLDGAPGAPAKAKPPAAAASGSTADASSPAVKSKSKERFSHAGGAASSTKREREKDDLRPPPAKKAASAATSALPAAASSGPAGSTGPTSAGVAPTLATPAKRSASPLVSRKPAPPPPPPAPATSSTTSSALTSTLTAASVPVASSASAATATPQPNKFRITTTTKTVATPVPLSAGALAAAAAAEQQQQQQRRRESGDSASDDTGKGFRGGAGIGGGGAGGSGMGKGGRSEETGTAGTGARPGAGGGGGLGKNGAGGPKSPMKSASPLKGDPGRGANEGKDGGAGPREGKNGIDMRGVKVLKCEDKDVIKLRGHTQMKVQPCAFNAKVPSLLATGGADGTCRIWDVPTTAPSPPTLSERMKCKHSSSSRRVDITAVAWDPSGSLLATATEDGIARIWTVSGDLHLVLSMHQRSISALKWSPGGTMLLTASLDQTVCLWEVSSGKVRQQYSTHSDQVLDVDWNDDGLFASTSSDRMVHLLSTSRPTPLHRFRGHRDDVNVVKFSPCGTLVASCADDTTVRVWSLRGIPAIAKEVAAKPVRKGDGARQIDVDEAEGGGGGGVWVLEGHESDVHQVAWHPMAGKEGSEGPRLLASCSFDSTAKLWDADAGTCLYTFTRATDFVYSISFEPTLGRFLATGSNDGRLDIWRVKDHALVQEYTHSGEIYELTWHPHGKQLAVCGGTEEVAVVPLVVAGAGLEAKA